MDTFSLNPIFMAVCYAEGMGVDSIYEEYMPLDEKRGWVSRFIEAMLRFLTWVPVR